MPGIVVGVDGSGHSRAALEWAVREAAVRHAPLTVVTVHQAPVEYLGNAVDQAQDHDMAERYRRAAQDAINRVFARAGEARPESVTVQSMNWSVLYHFPVVGPPKLTEGLPVSAAVDQLIIQAKCSMLAVP